MRIQRLWGAVPRSFGPVLRCIHPSSNQPITKRLMRAYIPTLHGETIYLDHLTSRPDSKNRPLGKMMAPFIEALVSDGSSREEVKRFRSSRPQSFSHSEAIDVGARAALLCLEDAVEDLSRMSPWRKWYDRMMRGKDSTSAGMANSTTRTRRRGRRIKLYQSRHQS